jgi:hypothetical protein
MLSFIRAGYEYHLYTYDRNLAASEGVTLFDAEEILPKVSYITYRGEHKTSFALFSDLFRYKLLYEKGDWWVDTDVVCMSNSIPELEDFFAWEAPGLINGAILYFKPRSSIMEQCFHKAREIGGRAKWGDIGPLLLTKMLTGSSSFERAYHTKYAYPIHWTEACDVLMPERYGEVARRCKDAWFLHLWNEVFRRKRVHKWALPLKGSFMHALIEKYSTDGWTSAYDSTLLSANPALSDAFDKLDRRNRKRLSMRIRSLMGSKASSN